MESKIPNICGLVTTSALTGVENTIPDVSSLVKKKTDYDTKISDIEKKITDHDHDEYITTSEFNKLTTEHFAARLAKRKSRPKLLPFSGWAPKITSA